jgi:hypothetical protein
VTQQARNLSFTGLFEWVRFLIHDRDSKFSPLRHLGSHSSRASALSRSGVLTRALVVVRLATLDCARPCPLTLNLCMDGDLVAGAHDRQQLHLVTSPSESHGCTARVTRGITTKVINVSSVSGRTAERTRRGQVLIVGTIAA